MKIIIDFAVCWYLIEFEPFLGSDIKKYQEEFEKWYYDETIEYIGNERCIVFKQRSDFQYECFDITPIIDWIKEVAPNANPKVLKYCSTGSKYDKSLPSMHF